MTKSTFHNVLYWIILKKCGGRGKFCSPKRKLVWWPPFLFVFLKGYIKIYGIKTNFWDCYCLIFRSTHHTVLNWIILKIWGGRGKFCSPKRKLAWRPPFFILFSKRLYKSLWNKNKTLRLLMLDLKKSTIHSILYWIILKIWGGRGKFCSPERKLVWWPPIFILFSKKIYKSLWNKKKKTLRLLMPDFLIYNLI